MLTYQASQHLQPHHLASQLAYYGQAPIQYFPASRYSYQSYYKNQSNPVNNQEHSTTHFADFVSQIAVQIWIEETHFSFPTQITLAKVPESFRSYTRHTLRAIQLSNSVSLIALKYVERLRKSRATLKTSLSSKPQSILAVALILAAKYLDDSTYTSKTWSDLLSVPLSELNNMEFEFLNAISYNIHVTDKEYLEWLQNLIRLAVQSGSVGQFSSLHADYNPITSEKRKLEVSINSNANLEYMYSYYHYHPLMVQWYHHPSKSRTNYSPEYYMSSMYENGTSYYHGGSHNYSMHPACGFGYV